MDRKPKPAPFPVGARVRYIGERRSWTERDGKRIPIMERGIERTIASISPGYRGTLEPLSGFEEDDGEPVLDRTTDSCSVYEIPENPGMRGDPQRLMIRPEWADEWERIDV